MNAVKRLITPAIFAIATICTQTANAAELFPDQKPRPFALADKLETDATIGGYPIWQGEGKWRIVDLVRSDSTGSAASVPLGTARFFQSEGKQWIAAMEVRSNLQSGSGFWNGEPCKRDDMLFKLQLGAGREDNCVTINHITRYMSNPGGKAAELYALLKEQGVDIPPTVLLIQLTRNGLSQRMLHYYIWINPELVGFARETESEWGRNPWNKTMSFNDPAKKQYIEALTIWATKFVNQMDNGLKQKPDAFSQIPTWRGIADGVVKAEVVKTKIILD
ncbi:hypothetical protein [Rhodoferax sp.]|uniref:hypothetical protein n=1 Tax=Rhodoferax sp. TaxID=50421 RepID=UPI0025E32614|nr:hypothetical protein [Rhodoferax sp.]